MECINKVELCGRLGSFKKVPVGGIAACRFSLQTVRAYMNASGQAAIDSTWHNIVAVENKNIDIAAIEAASEAKDNCYVCVDGFIRNVRYTDAEGDDHMACEIIAKKVRILTS